MNGWILIVSRLVHFARFGYQPGCRNVQCLKELIQIIYGVYCQKGESVHPWVI